MRKFKYIARNAKGYVEFQTPAGVVRMETGETVDVPDSLAKKLASNNHFEAVEENDEPQQAVEFSDNSGEIGVGLGHHESVTVTKRRGRKPKSHDAG